MNAFGLFRTTSVAGVMLLASSCVHVATDPIEVKPIHITLDVNIKVQKDLENFFAFEDDVLKNPGAPPRAPASAPAPASATEK